MLNRFDTLRLKSYNEKKGGKLNDTEKKTKQKDRKENLCEMKNF